MIGKMAKRSLVASIYPHPYDSTRHDSSATVLEVDMRRSRIQDVFAYEEAKCNSEKNFGRGAFPDRSLFLGLSHFGASPSDVDVWVFPSPPEGVGHRELARFFSLLNVIPEDGSESEIEEMFQAGRIRYFPHYLLHAGIASFTSPFSEGYFFTLDGGGDGGDPHDVSFGKFREGEGLSVDSLHRPEGPNITRFHDRITEYLGYDVQDNGKTNGLSAYGAFRQEIEDHFSSCLTLDSERFPIYRMEREARSEVIPSKIKLDKYSITKILYPAPGSLEMFHSLGDFSPLDVAATAEVHFSRQIIAMVKNYLPTDSGPKNLVVGGGAFNNVVLNREISQIPDVRPHFSMAPGDSGLSLGGALIVAAEAGCPNWKSPLIGPDFSDFEIQQVLEEYSLTGDFEGCQEDAVADVALGKVVGVFQGRAEYGPRSLGSRSIIGDPRNARIKARVNQYVKRRDFFMPFAPAVLAECIESYSSQPEAVNPYMQVATLVPSSAHDSIRAAIHVDGTARIQKVERELFPEFHELISIFREKTGVPALLNTSFNRHGISTISSPRQALEHLLAGAVDALLIGKFYIRFEDVRQPRLNLSEVAPSEEKLLARLLEEHAKITSEKIKRAQALDN